MRGLAGRKMVFVVLMALVEEGWAGVSVFEEWMPVGDSVSDAEVGDRVSDVGVEALSDVASPGEASVGNWVVRCVEELREEVLLLRLLPDLRMDKERRWDFMTSLTTLHTGGGRSCSFTSFFSPPSLCVFLGLPAVPSRPFRFSLLALPPTHRSPRSSRSFPSKT